MGFLTFSNSSHFISGFNREIIKARINHLILPSDSKRESWHYFKGGTQENQFRLLSLPLGYFNRYQLEIKGTYVQQDQGTIISIKYSLPDYLRIGLIACLTLALVLLTLAITLNAETRSFVAEYWWVISLVLLLMYAQSVFLFHYHVKEADKALRIVLRAMDKW